MKLELMRVNIRRVIALARVCHADLTLQRIMPIPLYFSIFQRGTNWADGGNGVNQCPISPSALFYYSSDITR